MKKQKLCFIVIVLFMFVSLFSYTAWALTESPVCQKDSYGRGAGTPVDTCSGDMEKIGALCYPKCKAGYKGAGPVCWQQCNDGYRDDGATCRRDAHIFSKAWSAGCPSGYRNDGLTCRRDAHIYGKQSYGRGAGKPLTCSGNKELDGALCYDKCKAGYSGAGPVCWENCSKDARDYPVNCGSYCGISKLACNPAIFIVGVVKMPPCTEKPSATPCNGSAKLCGKKYNEVTFPSTHNAHAVIGGGAMRLPLPGFDNQTRTMRDQLRDGIRGLMIDLYLDKGQVVMCHQNCSASNYGPFTDALRTYRRFLDANPTETITLILENYVDSKDIWKAIQSVNMESYVYYRPENEEWPTLSKLGKKIIIFSDKNLDTTNYPQIMDYNRNAFDNDYNYATTGMLDRSDCKKNFGYGETVFITRKGGAATHKAGTMFTFPAVFVMNHMVTPAGAIPVGWGHEVNKKERLQSHVDRCKKMHGRNPNFIAVDWYEEGALFDVVRKLNE